MADTLLVNRPLVETIMFLLIICLELNFTDDATMSLPSFFRLSTVSSVYPPLLFRLNSVEILYLSRDSKLLFK